MAKSKKNTRGRSSKKRVQAAEDTAETRTAATSARPNFDFDEDRQAQHMNTIRGFNQKIRDLQKQRKKATDAMVAAGYNLKAMQDLIKLEKLNPIQARDYHEQFALGLPNVGAGFRVNVFDAAFADAAAQAAHEGRAYATNGTTPECRWTEGSTEHKAFWDSYNAEQAKIVPGADKLTDAERAAAVKEGEARVVN